MTNLGSLGSVFVDVAADLSDLGVQLNGAMSDAQHAGSSISQSMEKAVKDSQASFQGLRSIGGVLTDVGQTLSIGLTLPILAVGGAAIKLAADFDSSMHKVASLIDGVTNEQFKNLSNATLKLSTEMGVDAVKSADALYQALSANIPQENVIDFLRISIKAAIAGMTDTKVAVDALTTGLAAFGLQTSETGKLADAMFAAVKIGKLEFPELASSMGIAAGTAHALGINYQELLAATATLTLTTGQKAPEAMTMLQSAMKALIEPTKDMSALIEKAGYASGTALIQAKGLEGALQAVTVAANGNIDVMATAYGRVEGLRGALGLTGANALIAAQQLGEVTNSAGGMNAAFEEIDKSAKRNMERFDVEVKNLGISFGSALLPAVNDFLAVLRDNLIPAMTGAVNWFNNLSPSGREIAVVLAGITAAIGPLTYALGAMFTAVASIGTGLSTLTGLLGMGTGLAGVLALATPVAIALGAAIAAWALYEAITQIRTLNAELAKTYELSLSTASATKEQASTIAALEAAIKAHNATLGAQQIEVSATGKTVEEYIKALKGAVSGLDDYRGMGSAVSDLLRSKLNPATAEAMDRVQAASKAQAAATKEAEKANEVYQETLRLHKLHIASNADVADALGRVQAAEAKLHPLLNKEAAGHEAAAKAADKHKQFISPLIFELQKAQQELTKVSEAHRIGVASSQDVEDATEKVRLAFVRLHPEWENAKEAADALKPPVLAVAAADDALAAAMHGTLPVFTEMFSDSMRLTAALNELGITTTQTMKRTADSTAKAYEVIANSSGATEAQVEQAWTKMTEAKLAYDRSIGDNKTADALQIQLDAHKRHTAAIENVWRDTITKVSTVFTDFTSTLIDQLFDGDFSVVGALEKVGKSLAKTFLEDGAKIVNDFVEQWIQKHLIGGLTDVMGSIAGIGTKIGQVFGVGSVSDISGGAPAPGLGDILTGGTNSGVSAGSSGASGTAGAIAGGLTGVVGAIGSVVTAVSSIIGNFQMAHQETSLNAIEHNTRYSMMYLGEQANGGILGTLYKIDEELAWGSNTKATEASKDQLSGISGLLDQMKGMFSYINPSLDTLKNISQQSLDALHGILDTMKAPTLQAASVSALGGAGGAGQIVLQLDGHTLWTSQMEYLEGRGIRT